MIGFKVELCPFHSKILKITNTSKLQGRNITVDRSFAIVLWRPIYNGHWCCSKCEWMKIKGEGITSALNYDIVSLYLFIYWVLSSLSIRETWCVGAKICKKELKNILPFGFSLLIYCQILFPSYFSSFIRCY